MNPLEQMDVHPRDLGHGCIRWTERLIMDVPSKGAALFGRMIGIYDYVNGFDTDIEELEDLHIRAKKFRELNIWFDNAPRDVRSAFSRVCGDFPGTGRDAVLDINMDFDDVRRWYDYEKDCLEVSVAMQKAYIGIWERDVLQMGLDLHFAIRSLNLIRSWREVPSLECREIFKAAFTKVLSEGMAQDYIDGLSITKYRQSFIDAWTEKETELLMIPAAKRRVKNYG